MLSNSKETNVSVSPRRLALSCAGAFLLALLVILVAVLPAEYGLDPLGTGEAFGLTLLSRVQPIGAEVGEYKTDQLTLVLAPTEWVELTYELEEGAGMLFSWDATGVVSYNFHSAPEGGPPGYAETFDAEDSEQAHGSYIAPFTGVHGWYWENPGIDYVEIRIATAGFYSAAHQARDRVSGFRTLRNSRGQLVEAREE